MGPKHLRCTRAGRTVGRCFSDEEDVERLRKVLILKRAFEQKLKHTLQAFRLPDPLSHARGYANRYHLIDREVAQLFYETKYPYQVAQRQLTEPCTACRRYWESNGDEKLYAHRIDYVGLHDRLGLL